MNPTGKIILFTCFCLLSIYVVYEHATSGAAVDLATQIDRHKKLIDGQSEFFNPWQYRILSALVLQAMIDVYQAVVPGKPEIVPYLALSFIQNVIIFYLAFAYYKVLGIRNPLLILAGIVMLSYSFASSTFASDLSFNTYFDIIFYLAAGWLILTGRYVWIVPLTIVATMNRETCGFIPLMLIAPFIDKKLGGVTKQQWIITIASLVGYVVVFVGIRLYYGYQPAVGIHGITGVKDYLLFNLKFFRMYPELIGTFTILPIIVLLGFKKLPVVLQRWFLLIVPVWIVIHFAKSTAVETRLFLVPMTLIFVPAFLWLIEEYSESRKLQG
ncbi:MAG: hypothetical protein WDO14_02955 [Bacteroidota bacterium]